MANIPEELVQSIAAGDCVLWAGAGIAGIAGRPGWSKILEQLIDECDEGNRDELRDLMAKGRSYTVLSHVVRSLGEEPVARVQANLDEAANGQKFPDQSLKFAALPWRACVTGSYAPVLQRLFDEAGKGLEMVQPGERDLNLGEWGTPFLLDAPTVSSTRRREVAGFMEEVVRTRPVLLLGFDREDPDFAHALRLLARVGRGRTHWAWIPGLTRAEADELEDEYGVCALELPAESVAEALATLSELNADASSAGKTAHETAVLDLDRAVGDIPLRADAALDAALAADPGDIADALDTLSGPLLANVDRRVLLRAGCVLLAHRRLDRARKCFQEVVRHGARPEHELCARFNLAFVAAYEGDSDAAIESLSRCAEEDRDYALVTPRYELRGVRTAPGQGLILSTKDRESGDNVEIAVTPLQRALSSAERKAFDERIAKLVSEEHPNLMPVVGAYITGRVMGLVTRAAQGLTLAETLEAAAGSMSFEAAFEIVGPLMEVVDRCHERGLVHGNINPSQIVLGSDGPLLKGWGLPPAFSYARATVRSDNAGFAAPEVLGGAPSQPEADRYALSALLYRLVAGSAATGSVPPLTAIDPEQDPRLDAVLRKGMHPDPASRPALPALRSELATVLTHPADDVDTAAPSGPERLDPPEDKNDLERWAWILERKPTHMQARENIDRIESEARQQDRWDRVCDVLNVRVQHSQVRSDRVAILQELAQICEQHLGAPQNALETLRALVDQVDPEEAMDLCDNLCRVAEATGDHSQLTDALDALVRRIHHPATQTAIDLRLASVLREQLGAHDRAASVLERATEREPDNLEAQRAAVDVYRQLGRTAELVGGLLTLGELEDAEVKADALVEAARILASDLDDAEGALATLRALHAEVPNHEGANTMTEDLARSLGEWDTVVDVLEARADNSSDPEEERRFRAEAAELARTELKDSARAIVQLQRLVGSDRSDANTVRKLVELLREDAQNSSDARDSLIDALALLVDLVDGRSEQADVLIETAALLDLDSAGGQRAADCRTRVTELLPPDDARAQAAAEALEKHFRGASEGEELLALYLRQGRAREAESAVRVEAWKKVLDLPAVAEDSEHAREALEALAELDESTHVWRDRLLARYLADEEFDKAGPIIRAQVDATSDPERKFALLVQGAGLRRKIGKTQGAIDALEEGVALVTNNAAAWAELAELYDETQQPLKALDAQVEAAKHTETRGERARLLFAAAKRALSQLSDEARATELLREVVSADPDHREASGLLLDQLSARGALEEAWPLAQNYVLQTKAQAEDDRAANLKALGIAGRCALAVDERSKALEYLEQAKALDAGNVNVMRLLADLQLDDKQWSESLKNYQSVLLGSGEGLAPAEQAGLYVRMAQARVGMEESRKAIQMLERAKDIDADNEEAITLLIELRRADGDLGEVAVDQRALADLWARREATLDESERPALQERRVALLQDVAKLQADELSSPEDAVLTLEQVLEIRPDDPGVLHSMLDMMTSHGRWRDAFNVLGRLAHGHAATPIKAKYLYAGAVILRDNVEDLDGAARAFREVLELDPENTKAYSAAKDILEKREKWHELARLLRARLKAMPSSMTRDERVALFERLGELYEHHLGSAETAIAAYEQAAKLADSTPAARVDGHRRVMELALGEDLLDKAVEHAHAIVSAQPMEFGVYSQLVALYREQGQEDAARCVARVLRFFKQANDRELQLAGEVDETTIERARSTMTRDLWRGSVYHADQDPRLTDVFGMIWPMVALREGRSHNHYGVNREQREQVSGQSMSMLARYVAYSCQVLDTPVPDFFTIDSEAAKVSVAALVDGQSDVQTVYPTIISGSDVLGSTTEAGLCFKAARATTRARPEHLVASMLPSSSALKSAFYGAALLVRPDAQMPDDARAGAQAYCEDIRRYLAPARVEQLRTLIDLAIDDGSVDVTAWLRGVDYTCTRVGYILAGSLEVCARILNQEGEAGTVVAPRERLKDLLAYAVSPEYFAVRRKLGLS